MIAYRIVNTDTTEVLLEGKKSGVIRTVQGGFQYVPNGMKEGGEVFKTKTEVRRSLENDD
jgi:hypothetical protein